MSLSSKKKSELITEIEELRAHIVKLKESEEKTRLLSSAVKQSSEGLAVSDMEGNLVFVNKAFASIHGYEIVEILGKHLSVFHTPDQMSSVESANRIIKEKGEFSGEIWHARRDGTIFPTLMQNSILKNENGEPVCLIGTLRDITNRKKLEEELASHRDRLEDLVRDRTAELAEANEQLQNEIEERTRVEETLRKNEQKYRSLVEVMSDSVYELDKDLKYTYMSPQARDVTGREPEDHYGKTPFDFILPEEQERLRNLIHDKLNFPQAFRNIENVVVGKNGQHVVLETSAVPIYDAQGNLNGYLCIDRDISERKRAEEDFKASEERYRTLVEQAQEVIYTLDPRTGKITSVNSYVETMLGYRQEDLKDRVYFLDMIHPDDRERVRNRMRAVVMGEPRQQDYPFRVRKADTTYIDVESNGTVVRDSSNNPYLFIGLVRDVTERKKMEKSLRLSEERYHAMLDSSHDMISIMDENGRIVHANRSWLEDSLYTIDEINELGIFQAIHPEDRSRALKTFEELKDGKITRNFEYRAIGKDGKILWRQVNVDPVYWPGTGKAYLNIIREITDRKRAEEMLLESEERYRTLFEESHDIVYVTTPEGKIVDMNPAGIELLGYSSKEELLGIDIPRDSYWNPDDRKAFQREIAKQGFVEDYELHLKNSAGERLIVLVTANAVRDEEGNIVEYRGIMHDITNRRQLEIQLQRAGRLAAIGELAAGIAHEVNNPIAAIDIHTGLIREILDDEKERLAQSLRNSLEGYLRIVEEQVQRCQSVTGQLLSFVRIPRYKQDAVDVNELLKRTLKLSVSLSDNEPHMEMDLAENLPPLRCDPNQLQQVFINLFNNAIKAIEKGGTISVATHLTDDGEIGLTIKDTGYGMPPEIQERIFDPFFTGTPEYEGTGLGLSISHFIVKQLEGRIEVESSPGRGSTFTVILPVADGMTDGASRD